MICCWLWKKWLNRSRRSKDIPISPPEQTSCRVVSNRRYFFKRAPEQKIFQYDVMTDGGFESRIVLYTRTDAKNKKIFSTLLRRGFLKRCNCLRKEKLKYFICGEEQKYHHFDSTRHDWRQTSFQHGWTIAPQGCLPYWAVHWTARYGECRIGFNTTRHGDRRRIMPCRTEILWNISIRHGMIRSSLSGVSLSRTNTHRESPLNQDT